MTGAVDGGVQVAGSFIDALKREPLSLALVLMNLALLLFFYVLLTAVAAQREREIGLLYADKKDVRELLAKCVVPERRSEQWAPHPTPLPLGSDPPKPGRSEIEPPKPVPQDPT